MELASRPRSPRRRTERVRELAVARLRARRLLGLARCDFFVEPDGEVLVNEINTMPGFTETSVYAKLWEATGIAYPDLCDRWSSSPSSATGAPAPTSSESKPPSSPDDLEAGALQAVRRTARPACTSPGLSARPRGGRRTGSC